VDLASGTEFAGYRIERTLGRGGMGVVYLAEHERLKRKVALKVLAPELAVDERFRERFIRESELAASLDQPNVLPVYDAGEQDGHLFIAMRYVDGADLRELIDESPVSVDDMLTVLADVARALDAAHSKGLVHRDVKPGNILIARSSGSRAIEHVYLTDFGLTKRSTSRSGLTGTGVFVGTLEYAAPEQFEGKPLGPQTDVYSLGCVLFECLTGEPPFRREQDAAVMYAHLHDPPPSAATLRPGLSRNVDQVIEKAMAKRPDDRYATAGELSSALRDAVAGKQASEPRPFRPRSRGRLAVAGALVAVAVMLAIVVLARGGDDPRSGRPSPDAAASALPAGSLARVDPDTGEPTLETPGMPGLERTSDAAPTLAVGEGGVWLYSLTEVGGFRGFLTDIDPETGEVRERLPVARIAAGSGLAVGFRTVWFSGADDASRVSRINPSTYEPLPPVSIAAGVVTDIVLGAERLWVGSSAGTLTEFNPLTGRRLDEIPIDGMPDALAYGEGSIWVLDSFRSEVIRVDPVEKHVVERIVLPGNPKDIAAGDGGIWVLDALAGTATQIDPVNDAAGSSIRLGPAPSDIAVGLGWVWVSDGEDGNLYRIDPELGRATPIPLGTPLAVVAIDDAGRSVWVGAFADP
jgi:tRNA A-37 threonylcarbamoyl transferase component Bud32/streptogramin lyase